jgi:hypothetical protein
MFESIAQMFWIAAWLRVDIVIDRDIGRHG